MLFKGFRNKKKERGGRASSVGPSIITAEVVIDGSLMTGGELQIDGTINGDVRAMSAVIDVQGIVHGQVTAEEVAVRGRVIGPIRGLHVHIYSGAHVEGDVVSEAISIENGAYIDGAVHRSDDPLNEPARFAPHTSSPFLPGSQNMGVYDEDGYRPVNVIAPNKPKAAE